MESIKNRRESEMQFLMSIFPSLDNMKGVIVRMRLETGYDEFKRKFGDPLKEHTLIIRDDDYMFLVFEHDVRKRVKNVCKDVIVVDQIRYGPSSYIYKKIMPAQVPGQLVEYIFDFVPVTEGLVRNLKLNDSLDNFLERYCVQGGLARLTEIKALPGWRKEWREQLDVKPIQMCKSCGNKALKGCCEGYAITNRKMLWMVCGWSVNECV